MAASERAAKEEAMRLLRNLGRWAAAGGLMLAAGSALGAQSGPGNGSGGTGTGSGGSGTVGSMAPGSAGRVTERAGHGCVDSDRQVDNPLPPIPGEDSSRPPQTEEEQAKMRNIERQKKLQDDTAKLLSLANELRRMWISPLRTRCHSM